MATNPPQHRESFRVIHATRDGLPALILIDAGLNPALECAAFRWHIAISIPIQNPSSVGLCGREESERLGTIEDFLLKKLTMSDYRIMGHITWNGVRDVFIYVRDPDRVIPLIEQQLMPVDSVTITITKLFDPEWSVYNSFDM